MKTIYYSSLLLLGCLINAGCSKLLDKQPISTLPEEKFYRNTAEVEAGVLGCYAALRPIYNGDYILAGLRSDDSYISVSEGDMNQVDGFGENPTNSYVAAYWQDSYFAIKQCNTILKYLGNVTDPVKKDYFEGEARFIRALVYFNMVRLWGDVPLVTTAVDYNASTPRTNKEIVIGQIMTDLDIASQKLPGSWDVIEKARATKYAAKGMLAKVFLTHYNYPEAKYVLQDLIQNSGDYQLLPDYRSVFGVNDEMNNEVMFAVRYKSYSNGLGNTFTYNMDKLSGSVGFRAAGDFRNNSVFPDADSIRKWQTFLHFGTYGTSYYCGGKYLDPGSPRNDGGTDFIVLRYADIIMMYAEAVNEIDGDTPLNPSDESNPLSRLYQLNRIRKRAAGNAPSAVPAYLYSDPLINGKVNFRNIIKAERRKEFGIEDQRWHDLVRWGDAITVMNAHFLYRGIGTVLQDYQALYPIPQREIDVSGHIITQNPGY